MAKDIKTGGRVQGTPNKRTAEGQAIFKRLGFDCIEESIEIYRNWKEQAKKGPLKQRRAYQDLMSQLLGRLTQYQYAKLRSIEITVEDEELDALIKLFEGLTPSKMRAAFQGAVNALNPAQTNGQAAPETVEE